MADVDTDDDGGDNVAPRTQAFLLAFDADCAGGPVFTVQSRNGHTHQVRMVEANTSIFCQCAACLRKEERCPHLLFVMGRVLRLTQADLEAMEPSCYNLGTDAYRRALAGLQLFRQHRKLYRAHCAVCLDAFTDGDADAHVIECTTCLAACHKACHARRCKHGVAAAALLGCDVCGATHSYTTTARKWDIDMEWTRPEVRHAPRIPAALRPPPRVHYRAPKRQCTRTLNDPVPEYPD